MIYKPHYFKLEELVSPEIFKKYGERAWQFLDPRLLASLDAVRVLLNVPMTVNNWKTGGPRKWSGFRERACPVGAEESQHRFGRACDAICSIPAKEAREKILASPEKFPHLSVLEDGVSWIHMDIRMADWTGIKLIKP